MTEIIRNPSPSDYLAQFQRLLPRGRVWQRGWGTVQAQQLLALMPTWTRLHLAANELIADVFPCSPGSVLAEWETTLGLPDPCTGPLPTIQQRRDAVCGKFTARGGQSRLYFIHLAASLGYQIQIEAYTPFFVDLNRVGDHLNSEAWAHAWRIIVQGATNLTYFRAGISAVGEPLADWGRDLLRCTIEEYAPAETAIVWSYLIDASIWDEGASIWDQGESIWDQGAIADEFAD